MADCFLERWYYLHLRKIFLCWLSWVLHNSHRNCVPGPVTVQNTVYVVCKNRQKIRQITENAIWSWSYLLFLHAFPDHLFSGYRTVLIRCSICPYRCAVRIAYFGGQCFYGSIQNKRGPIWNPMCHLWLLYIRPQYSGHWLQESVYVQRCVLYLTI